jgi:hypothetical protein
MAADLAHETSAGLIANYLTHRVQRAGGLIEDDILRVFE